MFIQTANNFQQPRIQEYQRLKKAPTILKGFLNQLLKKNNILTKLTRPFLSKTLKNSSNPSGFKKLLYNRVKIQNHKLIPSYNRRKHNHSYHIIVTNQLCKLSKNFNHLKKKKLNSYITFALKQSFNNKSNDYTLRFYNQKPSSLNTRPIPSLVSLLEVQTTALLWRNQFKNSLAHSRQAKLHNNTGLFLKNGIVLVLKNKV